MTDNELRAIQLSNLVSSIANLQHWNLSEASLQEFCERVRDWHFCELEAAAICCMTCNAEFPTPSDLLGIRLSKSEKFVSHVADSHREGLCDPQKRAANLAKWERMHAECVARRRPH